jgi:hypothetical protein
LRKNPEASETAASTVFRSTLVIVMTTSGTVDPDESVSVPAMLPYTAWAVAGAVGMIKAISSVNDTASRRCTTTAARDAARVDGARIAGGAWVRLGITGNPLHALLNVGLPSASRYG